MTTRLNGMRNWSRIVHTGVEETPKRVRPLLREVADRLDSETAFVLAPSAAHPGFWEIPEGWVYSRRTFPAGLSVPADLDMVSKAMSEESVVFDTEAGDIIPEPLAKAGVKSVVAAAVGYPEREALLVVCNARKVSGNPPFQVRYTMAHVELALVMARVISMDGVGRLIHGRTPEVDATPVGTWASEKPELLQTHPGWFVAYQEGKRVALEPNLPRLVASLDARFGRPRRPCEYHEIVEQSLPRRGPSPRARRGWDES